MQTGNVPLGGACLKTAVDAEHQNLIEISPESIISYLGDGAVLDYITSKNPDAVGFTLFSWNVQRSLFIAEKLRNMGIKIILGGPEASKDNELILNFNADHVVSGEGEVFFRDLVNPKNIFGDIDNCRIFKELSSPYVLDMLEPEIQDSMMLETQRGCPYSCGYCYYNKSRKGLCFKPLEKVYEGIRYAREKEISEVYLLDPSLNARKDLKEMLYEMIRLNNDKKLAFHSEIRSEAITEELADLFMEAGFMSFEIGLQSTNKKALSVMKRPTNLEKFLRGVNLLKERGINPCVDLIAGLPGDDPEGLRRSIDFICENDLTEEVQFFPLSIIPGTDFRMNKDKLGLKFNPHPPYNIISTETFTEDDILDSFDYAEEAFGISFFPTPDLDLSHKKESSSRDVYVEIGGREYVSKVLIFEKRDLEEIEKVSRLLTQPYQVFFGPEINDRDYIVKIIEILTSNNIFAPFEAVFIDPEFMPDEDFVSLGCRLKRPHFLDGDNRFFDRIAGNRAFIVSIVSSSGNYGAEGCMEREILLWDRKRLPDIEELYSISEFDGILIGSDLDKNLIADWQNDILPYYENLPHISFSDISMQINWIRLSSPDSYFSGFFDNFLI